VGNQEVFSVRNPKPALDADLRKAKQELFRQAFKRVDYSISKGFHLEAIAIIESLICDRLETAVTVITGEQISPKNLGPLIRTLESLQEFPAELIVEINQWRRDRNLVMHQMVKITYHEVFDWKSRMRFARSTAQNGKMLVKRVNAATNKIKNNATRRT
jgi:hypothetical protein